MDKAVEGETSQPRKSSKGMRMIWKLSVAVKEEGCFCVYSATAVFQTEKHLFAFKRKAVKEGEQSKGFSHSQAIVIREFHLSVVTFLITL